ncbi:hypothetical protein [Winogradskyella forsetii]|uniref:hypothetical protein n=1 Tax=Winogradskyella forsetii TaxID=2686077 RepID=UPI0021176CD7|nr:hypothetical protein [Winogradskyella forsetii]
MKNSLMKPVLVFKTSICNSDDVSKLHPLLKQIMTPNDFFNFDLEDCDNILRVETSDLKAESVLGLLRRHGFYCEELH